MSEAGLVDSSLPVALSICLAFFCALGSAVFSGLTLGLLTLDLVQLKLVINRPKETRADEINSRYAKRILPLRKDGNYLLVTLLTGNVAVNAGFSLLLGGLTDGLVGFLVSTVVITIFGEILPQAVCARHGLRVGGNLAWFVWALEWLLYPVVKPIAAALNCLLGEDLGTIYDRKQLRALVEYHDNVVHVLTSDEARILKGGLDFAFVRVDRVMTPIDRVYGLEIDTKLTFERISKILSCGFSRIPVLDFSSPQCIVGLLYMKDLALFDPYAEVEVRTLLHLFGRNVYAVDDDTALLDLLAAFKKGHTHLAVVRSVVSTGEGDPYYRHVGIITMEDIIEEILQDEIHDEFDNEKQQQQTEPATPCSLDDGKRPSTGGQHQAPLFTGGSLQQLQPEGRPAGDSNMPTGASSAIMIPITGLSKPPAEMTPAQQAQPHPRRCSGADKHWGSCTDCHRPQLLGCGVSKALAADRRPLKMISHVFSSVFPSQKVGHPVDEHTILRGRMKLTDKGRVCDCLSRSEALAVSTFLCCAERCFQPPSVSPLLLLVLLQHMRPIRVGSGVDIFTRGNRAYHAALVLQGRLKLEAGSERIACRVGPWTTLAMHCLSMQPLPKDFQTKRERLQQAIGDKDISSYFDFTALDQPPHVDAPTAGSCTCGRPTSSSEREAAGGPANFQTTALHAHFVHPAAANSGSGNNSNTNSGCPTRSVTSRDPIEMDPAGGPSSLVKGADDGPLCRDFHQDHGLLRSASPRCFSALQAPNLQHPAREYVLVKECKGPESEDTTSMDVRADNSGSPSTSPTQMAWRNAGPLRPVHNHLHSLASHKIHPTSCATQVASRSCTSLSSLAVSGSSLKSGASPTGPLVTKPYLADMSPPVAAAATASPPLVPLQAEQDAAAGAPEASRPGSVSPTVSDGLPSPNMRLRGSDATGFPGSCSPTPCDDTGQPGEAHPQKGKRGGRNAARAATAAFIGNAFGRKQKVGKKNTVLTGSSSSNSSGNERRKAGSETHKLFCGLLHGRPHGYRELKRRPPKAPPSSREVPSVAEAAKTSGPISSWAPECTNDLKGPCDGTPRRSVSLHGSRAAGGGAIEEADGAGEDGSGSSGYSNISHKNATNGTHQAALGQEVRRGRPDCPDTVHPHSQKQRPLLSELMHGLARRSTPTVGSLGEEETQAQSLRFYQLRQRIVTTHHPLQPSQPASTAIDPDEGANTGNTTVPPGAPESSAQTSSPVEAPDGSPSAERALSLQQQLEAQDEQLRGIMQQLARPVDNPALLQLLKDSGWTLDDFAGVDSFFDSVLEQSAYFPDFSSRTEAALCQTTRNATLRMLTDALLFHQINGGLAPAMDVPQYEYPP